MNPYREASINILSAVVLSIVLAWVLFAGYASGYHELMVTTGGLPGNDASVPMPASACSSDPSSGEPVCVCQAYRDGGIRTVRNR